MHPRVCKHSLLPICCRVHVHPYLGLPAAFTRPNTLTIMLPPLMSSAYIVLLYALDF